jgi:hypothetical protein
MSDPELPRAGHEWSERITHEDDAGTLHGEAVPVADGVDYGLASLITGGRGVLIYQGRERVTHLTWFDRSGRVLGVVGPRGLLRSDPLS